MDFSVNNQIMGSEIPLVGRREIKFKVCGTTEIDYVEIIRNNQRWRKFSGQGHEFSASVTDTQTKNILLTPEVGAKKNFIFYYLRVVQKDSHRAISSPVWLAE